MDQGLTYTPPTDPPVLPSADDREGLDIAAGFALSMEDSDPDVEMLPEGIDNNDLDLEDDVYEAIRFNSETQNLTDVRVRAGNGVVALFGTVPDDQDLERLVDLVEDLEGVQRVLNHLVVEEEGGPEE
jgi:osmotically-inducible protein OsmY